MEGSTNGVGAGVAVGASVVGAAVITAGAGVGSPGIDVGKTFACNVGAGVGEAVAVGATVGVGEAVGLAEGVGVALALCVGVARRARALRDRFVIAAASCGQR